MRVRPAAPDDVEVLLDLERDCFGVDAWSERALRDELAGVPSTRHVVVGEDDSRSTVGYAVLMVLGDVADVQRVAVAPARRGRGHGLALTRALLAEAAARGCVRVLLEVEEANVAARALYAAAGFTEVSRRRGYYGAGRDALVLGVEPTSGHEPGRGAEPNRRTSR